MIEEVHGHALLSGESLPSMDHQYTFFDRSYFDEAWNLTWRDFGRSRGSRWFRERKSAIDGYFGKSLRELLSFCIDPQPSAKEIESCLDEERIRQLPWPPGCAPFHFVSGSGVDGGLGPDTTQIVAADVSHNLYYVKSEQEIIDAPRGAPSSPTQLFVRVLPYCEKDGSSAWNRATDS
jgi:hypothetical protein